jgi:hypothetical protein
MARRFYDLSDMTNRRPYSLLTVHRLTRRSADYGCEHYGLDDARPACPHAFGEAACLLTDLAELAERLAGAAR